jgi:hypothetical protein
MFTEQVVLAHRVALADTLSKLQMVMDILVTVVLE